MARIPLQIESATTTADANAFQGKPAEMWFDLEANQLHIGTTDQRAGGVIIAGGGTQPGNLGTMAYQNANAVAITGGAISAVTVMALVQPLSIADGGTGANNATTARSNLGLGDAATLNVGTNPNNIVQLNAAGQLPVLDGRNLTNVIAASGTLNDVLSAGNSSLLPMSVGTLTLSAEPLPISSGGTGATNTGDARASLGIGTLGSQNANDIAVNGGSLLNVTITGANISNLNTPLEIFSGGTGASDGLTAIRNLGLLQGTSLGSNYQLTQDLSGGTAVGIFDLATGKYNLPPQPSPATAGIFVTSVGLETGGQSLAIQGSPVSGSSGNNTGVGVMAIDLRYPKLIPSTQGGLLPNNITGVIDHTTGTFSLFYQASSSTGLTSVGINPTNSAILVSNSPLTSNGNINVGLRNPVITVTSPNASVSGTLDLNQGTLSLSSSGGAGGVTSVGIQPTTNSIVVGNSPITSSGNIQVGLRYPSITVTSSNGSVQGNLNLDTGVLALTTPYTGTVTSIQVTTGAGLTVSPATPVTNSGTFTINLKYPQITATGGNVTGTIDLTTGMALLNGSGGGGVTQVYSDASLSGLGIQSNPLTVAPFVLTVNARQTSSVNLAFSTAAASGVTAANAWNVKARTSFWSLDGGTTQYPFNFTLPANIPDGSAGWQLYFSTLMTAMQADMANKMLGMTFTQSSADPIRFSAFAIKDYTNNWPALSTFVCRDTTPNITTTGWYTPNASPVITLPAWSSSSVNLGTGLQSAITTYLNPIYDARYVRLGYANTPNTIKIGTTNQTPVILGAGNTDALRIAATQTQSVSTTNVSATSSSQALGVAIVAGNKYMLRFVSGTGNVLDYNTVTGAANAWQTTNLSLLAGYNIITSATVATTLYFLAGNGLGTYQMYKVNNPAASGGVPTISAVGSPFIVYDNEGVADANVDAFDISQDDNTRIAIVVTVTVGNTRISTYAYNINTGAINTLSYLNQYNLPSVNSVAFVSVTQLVAYSGTNYILINDQDGTEGSPVNVYGTVQGTFFAQSYVDNGKKWSLSQGYGNGEFAVLDLDTSVITRYTPNASITYNNHVSGVTADTQSNNIYAYYGYGTGQPVIEVAVTAGTIFVQSLVDLKDRFGNIITGAGTLQNIRNQAWRQATAQSTGSGADAVVLWDTAWTSNGNVGLTRQSNGGFTNTSGQTQSFIVSQQITFDLNNTGARVVWGAISTNSTNPPTGNYVRYGMQDIGANGAEYNIINSTDVITLANGDTYFTYAYQTSGQSLFIGGAFAGQPLGYSNHITFTQLTPVSGSPTVGTIDQVLQQGNTTNRNVTLGSVTAGGLQLAVNTFFLTGGTAGQVLTAGALGAVSWQNPASTYTLPIATTTTLGGIKPDGTTIIVDAATGVARSTGGTSYTLPVANTTTLGGVKAGGTNVTIAGDGTISSSQPLATTTSSGIVTVGSGVNVTNGVISVTPYSLPIASTSVLGGVKPDGTTITINAVTGVISASGGGTYTLPIASASVLGGIKVGTGLTIDAGGVLSASNGFLNTVLVGTTTGNVQAASRVIFAPANFTVTYDSPSQTATITALGGGGGGAITITNGTTTVASATQLTIGGNITLTNPSTGTAAINVPIATKATLGLVKSSTGLAIDANGNLSLNAATTSTIGGVYASSTSGLSLGADGGLSLNLPTATASILGGVKVGTTLSINSGVLNYILPVATSTTLGAVKVGSGIAVAADGTISVSALATPITIANGGTGATTQLGAQTNLGIGSAGLLNTGTTQGTIPVLGANGKLPSSTLPVPTSANLGGITIATGNKNGVTTDAYGVLTTVNASTSQVGVVQIPSSGGLTVDIGANLSLQNVTISNQTVSFSITAAQNRTAFLVQMADGNQIVTLPNTSTISDGYFITLSGENRLAQAGFGFRVNTFTNTQVINIAGVNVTGFIVGANERVTLVWSTSVSAWFISNGNPLTAYASQYRTNLGLGTGATANTGTTSGSVPVLGAGGRLGSSLLPIATGANIGGVTPDNVSLAVNASGQLSSNPATTTSLGAVSVGAGLTVTAGGQLSTTGYGYAGISAYNS